MKLFVRKFVVASAGFLCFYLLVYFGFNQFYNPSPNPEALFIWGDSQAHQGIDLNALRTSTNQEVFTSSIHGAGVYDFLVFAEKVPEESEVIVAISKPAQLRKKSRDRNRSGFSMKALVQLYQHGYTHSEIYSIIKKNLKPARLFQSQTEMYPVKDSISKVPTKKYLSQMFNQQAEYIFTKQELYLKGIQVLKDKGCKVNLIEFPYHAEIELLEKGSANFVHTENLKSRITEELAPLEVDTIYLNSLDPIMFDYTHLNQKGASLVADELGKILASNSTNQFVIISWKQFEQLAEEN